MFIGVGASLFMRGVGDGVYGGYESGGGSGAGMGGEQRGMSD